MREMKATESELKKLVGQFDDLQNVPTTGSDLEGFFHEIYLITLWLHMRSLHCAKNGGEPDLWKEGQDWVISN